MTEVGRAGCVWVVRPVCLQACSQGVRIKLYVTYVSLSFSVCFVCACARMSGFICACVCHCTWKRVWRRRETSEEACRISEHIICRTKKRIMWFTKTWIHEEVVMQINEFIQISSASVLKRWYIFLTDSPTLIFRIQKHRSCISKFVLLSSIKSCLQQIFSKSVKIFNCWTGKKGYCVVSCFTIFTPDICIGL